MKASSNGFRLPWLLPTLLLLAGAIALPAGHAAEKLFDFGNLNVDLSKIQTKPQSAPGTPAPEVKQAPAQQLPSTPESPAPQVLPRDGQEDIGKTLRAELGDPQGANL